MTKQIDDGNAQCNGIAMQICSTCAELPEKSMISSRVSCSAFAVQKWSRRLKARGQGQGQECARPRTRTGMLEAKAKDQGHKCKCFPKKKVLKFFSDRSPKPTVWKNIFQPIYKILTIHKIVLSSSRGKGNFRGLELRGRGQGQGLENVSSRTSSKQRTSSRTPTLICTTL